MFVQILVEYACFAIMIVSELAPEYTRPGGFPIWKFTIRTKGTGYIKDILGHYDKTTL